MVSLCNITKGKSSTKTVAQKLVLAPILFSKIPL